MKDGLFYLGLGLLLTHEMDAMPNHEWRVLPLTSFLSDPTGELVFLAAHVPLFALVIGVIASLNLQLRARARFWTCVFLIAHAGLHLLFSAHADYDFSRPISSFLICAAALCGGGYLTLFFRDRRRDAA